MLKRPLDTETLDLAASQYAAMFIADKAPFDRAYVMRDFYDFDYKDEFDYLVDAVVTQLGPAPADDFWRFVDALEPRTDKVFHALLEEKLPAGYDPALHYHGWYGHDHSKEA